LGGLLIYPKQHYRENRLAGEKKKGRPLAQDPQNSNNPLDYDNRMMNTSFAHRVREQKLLVADWLACKVLAKLRISPITTDWTKGTNREHKGDSTQRILLLKKKPKTLIVIHLRRRKRKRQKGGTPVKKKKGGKSPAPKKKPMRGGLLSGKKTKRRFRIGGGGRVKAKQRPIQTQPGAGQAREKLVRTDNQPKLMSGGAPQESEGW